VFEPRAPQTVLSPAQSRELLREVDRLQRVVQRPIGLWPPLIVFGTAAVLGALLSLFSDPATNLWWALVAAPCVLLTAWCSRRHCRRHGIERPSRRMIVLGIGSFAAGWLCCLCVGAAMNLPDGMGWGLAVGVGYLGWSRLARSGPVALIAIAIITTAATTGGLAAPVWTTELAVGLAMLVGGTALRLGPEAM